MMISLRKIQRLNYVCRRKVLLSIAFCICFCRPVGAVNTLTDYTSYPPFLASETPPNVIIALDISGSMKQPAYSQPDKAWKTETQADFNKNHKYFGYFDSDKRYSYDAGKQFFKVDDSGGWSGNFLNWLCMRRIDVARKVIVGGKVSVTTRDQDMNSASNGLIVPINRNKAKGWGDWQANWDGWYVLEGQNEPYDYQFYKQYPANANEGLTPADIPDNTRFMIHNQRLIPLPADFNEESLGRPRLDGDASVDAEQMQDAEVLDILADEPGSGFAIRIGVRDEPVGLLQKAAHSMRFGVAVYNFDHHKPPADIYINNSVNGGTLNPCYPDTGRPVEQRTNYDICLSTGVHDPLLNSIRVVEEHPLIWGTTPIAETLVEIGNYLRQNNARGRGFYDDRSNRPTYPSGLENDPYYYADQATRLPCAKTFVLHFNDGEPFRDWDGGHNPAITGDGVGATGLNEMLDDVAYSLRHNDLRTAADLPGHQEVISYYLLAALGESDATQYSTATRRLREAAINGGFYDDDGDHIPDPPQPADINAYLKNNADAGGIPDCSGKKNEWDRDGDCNPDNFYFATDGYALEQKLAEAFLAIRNRNASGTAASVISSSRSGEGAIYQSRFFPEYDDQVGHLIKWTGQLQALFVDAYGNMREDSNGNARLDLDQDLFITFSGDRVIKYRDGVEQADGSVAGANGRLDDYELATPVESGTADSIRYLWSATPWLNDDIRFDPLNQRRYASSDRQRYLFTFIDDGDLLAETGEVIDFSTANRTAIAPYLHAFSPFAYNAVTPPPGIASADFSAFVSLQTNRLIEWIRGKDQGAFSFSSSVIPPMRSRHYSGGTWRLGDIVNSTPTVVGRPAENFDLLYHDRTYAAFYAKYKDRRNVVYVGANDGIFHAFNAGFYDPVSRAYLKQPIRPDASVDSSKTDFELGAEIWGYVPFNLLPHLYWLSDPDYTHVYYADLKPKIFDANIFPNDSVHPYGWGTLLVGGMRFGGAKINADLNQNGVLDAGDPVMTSAYFILDITDPESPPELLAEITLPGLGYTTNYPMVITLRDHGLTGMATATDANDWYLLLGSGPASAGGEPDTAALAEAGSRQPGRIFLLNLNRLGAGTGQEVCFTNSSGSCVSSTADPVPLVSLDSDSFISNAIGVDWDLDFKSDAVYFGTVNGDEAAGWGGKLRRIVVANNRTIGTWDLNNTFLNLSVGAVAGSGSGQPITAAPTAGLDQLGNRWLFFGTGRYLVPADAANADQQSFYGLKEPKEAGTGSFTYTTLHRNTAELFDSSEVRVYEGGADVKNGGSATSFSLLQAEVRAKQGWFLDFLDAKERNLGQATLLGGILTFTTFVPNNEPCETGGSSWVYFLDYETGTAPQFSVIGTDPDDRTSANDKVADKEKVLKRKSLGNGLATSPGLHTGRQTDVKTLIQSSSGAISSLQQKTFGRTKSGMTSWRVE